MVASRITTIYIGEDVLAHAKSNKVNLSGFCDTSYREKYLSADAHSKLIVEKEAEIKRIEGEIETLRQQIKDSEHRARTAPFILTQREARFVENVPALLRVGDSYETLHERFVKDYGRNVTLTEFIKAVNIYNEKQEKRLAFALGRKKRGSRS